MAGASPKYGIAFFDFGDQLNSRVNVQLEVDRFVLIDEQLFGLYSVFGDGVISGWNLTPSGNAVTVSPGVAIIKSLACETDFPDDVSDLPSNTTVKLYAIVTGDTPTNRTPKFEFTLTSIPPGAIPLATVTTNDTGVSSIDTSIRQVIGFQQIIDQEVARHHHTGSPTKIQLDVETRGLLPGSRIAPMDASVLQSGKVSISRISQINHNLLKNVGLLTHAQLDSLVGSIQRDNEQLLGEISSVNLMKAIAFQKYKDAQVDEFFVNELAMIPGVSPDDFIDWDNTTAQVNKSSQCISGLPPELINPGLNPGTSEGDLSVVVVKWQTDADFNKASTLSNLVVQDGVFLLSDAVQNLVIDDFETVTTGPAGGYQGSLSETTNVSASYNSATASQGFFSGKFETKHSFHSTFKKSYAVAQDWSNYNELIVNVKSFSASHAAVYLRIDDSSGAAITTVTLLATDEITSIGNLATGGFAQKTFSLSGLNLKNVGSVTIYTDNITTNDEVFYLDNIFLRNTDLLLPQGTLRLRYSATTPVIFRSIDFTVDVPVGTDFRVRERVGMDVQSMLAAPYSTRLNAGDVFSTVGREIEIEITFFSDLSQTRTPLLSSVELQLLVQSEDSGFTISDAQTFNRGDFENSVVSTSGVTSFVKMQFTNVGDTYFLYEGIVNELDPTNVPQFGVNGGKLPVSPRQAFSAITGQIARGFSDATSVYRLNTANFIVADTGNDRVVETTPDGSFVRGFGCHNRDYDTTTYGLTAVYNPVIGKLFITFSMQIALDTFDLTQIHLNWNSNVLTLDNSSDQRRTLLDVPVAYNPNAQQAIFDRVLAVQLSADHRKLLDGVTDPIYVQLDSDPNLVFIECFNGDFLYYGRGAIIRPIYVNELEPGKWMIGNSHVFHGYDDIIDGSFTAAAPPGFTLNADAKTDFAAMVASSTSILSIIDNTKTAETSQSFGTTDFTFNKIDFSDVALGGIYPLPGGKFILAGLRKIQTSSSTSTSNDTSSTPPTDADRLAAYQGVVIVIDKKTSRILFTYESPEGLFPSDVFVDDNGLYVIAETSLIPQAGRIIRLDRFGNISAVISDGMYTKINDIRRLNGNHMLIST
jgi:hypothetical protein